MRSNDKKIKVFTYKSSNCLINSLIAKIKVITYQSSNCQIN